MRAPLLAFLLALLLAPAARADGERAGDFDYYVLSLGWSPSWCAITGDARGDKQCDPGRGFGFTLHGLWPQREVGWPSDCRSPLPQATRAETSAMANIMGSSGLAWHEWKKHGRCSGLSAGSYFATARQAYDSITVPDLFSRLKRNVILPASVVEDAFIEANPSLERDMITVTCDQGRVEEVRICLTKDLVPRPCAADTVRDCRMKDALMEKVR